jgi:TetR/AcrR family transcriptional repressor of nem operon
MEEAGLTVGGFYKHFASRGEQLAEALGDAFGTWHLSLAKIAAAAMSFSSVSVIANALRLQAVKLE